MQFVQPLPFDEALDKLGDKSPITADLSSSEWSDVPVALRERAFFSAGVTDVRLLQRSRDFLNDFLAGNRTQLESGDEMLAVGSRASFVKLMQDWLLKNGFEREEGGLTDITSESRLGLIFDTQTRQAEDFGYFKQGMDPDVLNEFPAQRFIRVREVKEERESHMQYQDQVYLKTDPIWALEINEDFGVPWGPWAWGCGHDVEDVDRDEAESLNLIQAGDTLEPVQKFFNENLQASVAKIDEDLLAKLQQAFGKQLLLDGNVLRWQPSGPETVPAPAPAAERQNPVSDAIQPAIRT